MSSIRKKLILVAAGVIWIVPGASARALALPGDGVSVNYDERPRSVLSDQSFLTNTLTFNAPRIPEFVAISRNGIAPFSNGVANSVVIGTAEERDEILSLSRSLEGETSSFADRVALRFSLADREEAESGISPLLLSALGLFALIARRRLIAR